MGQFLVESIVIMVLFFLVILAIGVVLAVLSFIVNFWWIFAGIFVFLVIFRPRNISGKDAMKGIGEIK
jgi:hypothetical protein